VNTLGTGRVVVDSTHAHSGVNAVKFTVAANVTSQRAYIETTSSQLFPLPQQLMYGRMWVWLQEIPVAVPNGPHWTTIQGDGPTSPAPPGITYATYNYGIQQTLLANYQDSSSPDCYRGSTTRLPVMRWACVEWKYDTPNQGLRFWLDGVAITALSVDHTGQGCVNDVSTHPWTGPNFTALHLGIQLYQASNIQIQYWIDDVAVGSARLGCP